MLDKIFPGDIMYVSSTLGFAVCVISNHSTVELEPGDMFIIISGYDNSFLAYTPTCGLCYVNGIYVTQLYTKLT